MDERRRNPGGQDQHTDDLHEGEKPVSRVIGVVGRGEPGEVHPGPPDGEEHRDVADEARAEVIRERLSFSSRAAWETATTKQRSKSSSSGVEARWGSSVLRATIGRSQRRVGRASPVSAGLPALRCLTGLRCLLRRRTRHMPQYERQSGERQKPPERTRGASVLEIPAATYSPRGPPPKYHRRGRA